MLPVDTLVATSAAAAGIAALLVFLFVRFIPNDRVGIVEKRFSSRGAIERGLIALSGEAGFQPNVLRGGLHLLNRIQHAVHVMPLVTIPQHKIGYVFARDGQPLGPTQTLGGRVSADDFQDVAAFLDKGGQRGPQRQILREGTYAINLVQFVVITDDKLYFLPLAKEDLGIFQRMAALIAQRDGFRPVTILGSDDLVGIVTVHDGPSLPEGEIIAPVVGDDPASVATYHNKFQDPERFLAAGGQRGRQLQVLVEGTYYVNRLFATVEGLAKTVVDVGHVGVVISYTGHASGDLSGAAYKHGEMVQRGARGVWHVPLLPGKYAFNTYAAKAVMVPTTNIILKWTRGQVGSHRYDENLAEVSLITKDAFEPNLPLSVVLHIDYRKAPLVIQRFGDIKRLVEQTLDPMVSAYFKNIGQTRTLIQLIQERSDIQRLAADQMREKFAHYDLELEEVLIGTPTSSQDDHSHSIEQILHQLRSRQIAEEQVETYGRQERAAVKERELREAEAR
ncbi:MAG: flotillin family protein, partial [Deltaproteobacteria bacterium]|nr:flotillin family protein [Deltaproteobacteria bacterium]